MTTDTSTPGGKATVRQLREWGVNAVPMWRPNADVVTAATVLGVRRDMVLTLVKTGQLRVVRLGNKRVIVPVSALAELLGEDDTHEPEARGA